MLTPNAFSSRSAISEDTAALPWATSDNVARRTPRIAAARVMVRPSAKMISSRMTSPGCGGFFIGISVRSLSSMIILKIKAGDGVALEREGNPPIARDGNAILAFAIALERMQLPARHGRHLRQVIGKFQRCQYPLDFPGQLRGHPAGVILFVQRPQPFMAEFPD